MGLQVLGGMSMFLKDPGSTLDYRVDWSSACAQDVSIVESVWQVQPPGEPGLLVDTHALDGKFATVRLSGGAIGKLYRVVNRVRFSNGSADEQTVALRVEER